MRGKRLVGGTIVTVLCMIGMLYLNSSVSKAYWVAVKSNNTRVRNAASTDSEVMTAVNAGDKLDVYSEEQGSDGNKWYKISINNVSGYVRADTVEKVSEEDAELMASTTTVETEPVQTAASSTVESMPSQAATVKQDNVNVRSEASTSGSVVAKLSSGAAVTLTGTSSDSEGKTWYQVNFINNGSNVSGYIREDFVELGEVVGIEEPAADPAEGEGAAEGGEGGLEDIYGEMPTEDGTVANNDYELFFEPDSEGVDSWYVHDNIAQKRYKLEQLMQADEMNTHNLEIKDKEIGKMKIAVIVLAVLFVITLLMAGFFGFKYHDLKDEDDEDDEDDDEDDDFREAPPVRRRARADAERGSRSREADMREERSQRSAQRQPQAGAARRPSSASGASRRPETEGRGAQRQPQARRSEGEAARRTPPAGTRQRSPQPGQQGRRSPAPREAAPSRSSSRGDVEWKPKNFITREEDEPDFSFIDMDEDI